MGVLPYKAVIETQAAEPRVLGLRPRDQLPPLPVSETHLTGFTYYHKPKEYALLSSF